MNTCSRLLLALALAAFASISVAKEAVTTNAVNVRAGPDRTLPTVTWLLSGTTVTVVGCVANWSWCDVIAGQHRGWIYSRYLSQRFEGSAITVARAGPALGLPVIDFSLGPYWDEHYQDKRWFVRKSAEQKRWDSRPPLRPWRDPAASRS